MSRRLLPKAYAALLMYLGLFPLFLLPAAALLPGRAWIAALLPIPALLLTGGAGLLPAKRRTLGLLASILVMAAGCLFLFLPISPPGMLLFLPCLFQMLSFMPAMARPAHQEWKASHLGFGIIVHVAAQFLKGLAVFEPVAAPVSWVFAAYLVACLFTLNRLMLADTDPSASKALLYQNRRLLAVLAALALLLSNLQSVARAVRAAIVWVIAAVMRVILWVTSLLQLRGGGGAVQGGNPLEGLLEETEPGLFAKIMEILLMVFAAAVAAVLLFFALKHLFRLLQKALRALAERLKLYRKRIAADYDDRSESLLDWGEIRKTAGARLLSMRKRFIPVRWERLSPADRVRRVYALLLRQIAEPNPALTAREMVESGALRLEDENAVRVASLYERARYSNHPVSLPEADDLRRRAGV